MRIGVNLLAFAPDRMGGLEHYVRRVLGALVQQAADEFVLFLPPGAEGWFVELPAARVLVRPIALDDGDTALERTLRGEGLDVWWCPWVMWRPLRPPAPAVVTVPDLQHEQLPEGFTSKERQNRRADYFVAAHCAHAVLTFSKHTRDDLIQRYGVAPDRVFATPLDVGYDWDASEPSEDVVRELRARVGAGFLYYPANTWPHKDHATLLRALRLRTDEGHSHRLVLTAAGAYERERLEQSIGDEGLAGVVTLLGTVSPEQVRALYGLSSAMVFPSRFEGFGMPLLEAMRSGVPVLSSDATSLPEVGGDAVVYFRAGDVSDLAEKIGRISEDSSLRTELVQRGRARASSFSWKETARATRAVLAFAARSSAPDGPAATALAAVADRLSVSEADREARLERLGASEADREARGDVIVRMASRIREVDSLLEQARPRAFHGLAWPAELRRVRDAIAQAAQMLKDLLH